MVEIFCTRIEKLVSAYWKAMGNLLEIGKEIKLCVAWLLLSFLFSSVLLLKPSYLNIV
jgi:hypothetical protein